MSTFTQHYQVGVCKICRQPIFVVECPTGDWWAHHRHPLDEHDAVYLEGQKPTPAEVLVLLSAWLMWHGHVLANRSYEGGGTFIQVMYEWHTIDAVTWHEHYKVEPS